MKIPLFTIPNLLTLSNLLCGAFAAVAVLEYRNLSLALMLIVAAAVFDFFDGFVARLLHSSSPIGAELDSLADNISFGLVPAAVAYVVFDEAELPMWFTPWMRYVGIALCFSISAFSALRLAKFNIDDTQHTEFEGLPTPANSLFFLALGWIWEHGTLTWGAYLPVLALAMGLMLVSPVRMFALKFKGFGWKGNEIRYGFILFSVLLLFFRQVYAIPVIILLYIIVSAIIWGNSKTQKKGGLND